MSTVKFLGDGLYYLQQKIDSVIEPLSPSIAKDALVLIYINPNPNSTSTVSLEAQNTKILVSKNDVLLTQVKRLPFKTAKKVVVDALFLNLEESFHKSFCGPNNPFSCLFEKTPYLLLEQNKFDLGLIQKLSTNPYHHYLNLMEAKVQSLQLFHHVLSTVLPNHGACNCSYINHRKILEKAKHILNEEYAAPPLVPELAHRLSISPYHLQEGFKNLTGGTVYEYIKRCRFRRASELLLNSTLSITDIALEVGYENPSKFTEMFKSFAKTTPLHYRKQK